MKKKNIFLFFLVIMLMLISASAFSQSHVITSDDRVFLFTDPTVGLFGTTWNDSIFPPTVIISSSLILSWDEGVTGINGGFADLTVYTPFANGGKYEISLISVSSSDANQITGIWNVKKNDSLILSAPGTAVNLDKTPEDTINPISISINGFIANTIITQRFDGLKAPQEVTGTFRADGTPLSGAKVKLKEDAEPLEIITTDFEGNYKFIDSNPADFKRVVGVYKNFDSNVSIDGYIYVGGHPLVGASVAVNQNGDPTILVTATTDASGYFQTPSILNKVGKNLRILIKK